MNSHGMIVRRHIGHSLKLIIITFKEASFFHFTKSQSQQGIAKREGPLATGKLFPRGKEVVHPEKKDERVEPPQHPNATVNLTF